jgi:hypothetical protein
MAGFTNISRYARSYDEGRVYNTTFRKVPSQASTAGWWVDLSMAPGFPVPNYYASNPLESAILNSNKGIYHSDDKAPSSKHLAEMQLVTPTAALLGTYTLQDYVLFYPFVDTDTTGLQPFENTVSLPRYSTGDGVQAMAVAQSPTTGGGSFYFTYYNQNGVLQTSPTQLYSTTAAQAATLVTSQQAIADGVGPYLRLATGDTGIRSMDSWVNVSSSGPANIAIVLVKPILTMTIQEIGATVQQTLVSQLPGPPRIYDDAYLGLICNCAASVAAGTLTGTATFLWSE